MRGLMIAALSVLLPVYSALACSSDYDCEYGDKCVKGQYQLNGECAQVVNQYGIKKYRPPDPQSVRPGEQGNCQFDTDCGVNGYCRKTGGEIWGWCFQR